MDTLQVQVIDTVQIVSNYLQSGDMNIGTWVTIFIAIIALCFSIWQGWQTRKHNRLSVTPNIDISLPKRVRGNLGISIKNTGTGPAIIDAISIGVKGEILYLFPTEENYEKIFINLGLDKSISYRIVTLNEGIYIEPRHVFYLIEFMNSKTLSKDAVQNVINVLMNIRIEIKYKSIYKEKFIKCSK
ncbi:MAG: hypothetical protein IIB95_05260 [Candidatus Marinimicrobia bacterium]|nr:hypothetical protein [Candidatus Neomarinimicrobiota bacterium]